MSVSVFSIYLLESENKMERSFVLQLLNERFEDIQLSYCGYAECEPQHTFGPATRPHYLIHFVLNGQGVYQIGGRKYHLHKNQGFLIPANHLTTYQADKQDPWTYIWIGIGGKKSIQYLQEIGLDLHHLVFESAKGSELEEIVKSMLQYKTNSVTDAFALQGLLYSFLSILSDSLSAVDQAPPTIENEYVKKAVAYIQQHYAESLSVSALADFISLNRSYLSTLFQKNMDCSIQEYILDFRITRAAELLTLTELSINQIAESCGYQDPLVFSKAFKRIKKKTPTAYRKHDRLKAQQSLEHLETQ